MQTDEIANLVPLHGRYRIDLEVTDRDDYFLEWLRSRKIQYRELRTIFCGWMYRFACDDYATLREMIETHWGCSVGECGSPIEDTEANPRFEEAFIRKVAQEAECAFWDVVARHYVEAESGDYPPEASHRLTETLVSAVKLWLHFNAHPQCPHGNCKVCEPCGDCAAEEKLNVVDRNPNHSRIAS